MQLSRQVKVGLLLVLVLGACVGLWWRLAGGPADRRVAGAGGDEATPKGEAVAGLSLEDGELSQIADFAAAIWRGEQRPLPDSLSAKGESVYVAARSQGRLMGEAWGIDPEVGQGLAIALGKLREAVKPGSANVDRLELFIATESRNIDAAGQAELLYANAHRGVVGLVIDSDGRAERYSPTYVVASNQSHEALIKRYGEQHGLDAEDLSELRYRFLIGPQLLLTLGDEPRAELMFRGNRQVPIEAVTRAGVTAFTQRMVDWMWNSLHADGRMTYMYLPSQGGEAPDKNNLIRQWMATVALGRIAAARNDTESWARATRNLDYNLATHYHEQGDLGLIERGGLVKLGVLALAALAIVEHRDRPRWSKQEAALRRSVRALWQPDGAFRTFFKPKDRNDNQNFFPGEALLLWATLYAEDGSEERLARLMQSYRYYRAWHLDETVPHRRNPAFIPWHTQACYRLWRQTKAEQLRDWIFEINDWLLRMMAQWDEVAYPDMLGRFYNPERPYGPPHASSTGVYLEGLIDAHELAREVGDSSRQAAYAQAIRRGLRSSMQLQFADEIDLFYVQNKRAVRGGLRTRVYDNEIRCDNVQHTLMATLKILATDLLGPAPEAAKSPRDPGPASAPTDLSDRPDRQAQ